MNSFFLLPEYLYQPYFYEGGIEHIPIVKTMLDNFKEIETEILNYCEHEKMIDYPRFMINKTEYIYYNKWEVASLSKLTEDPKRLNMDMIKTEKGNFSTRNDFSVNKKNESVDMFLSNSLEKQKELLETKRKCPFISALIKELEDKNILQNAYISKLYPECVISPHIDRHRDLLRFQLCVQEDENCIITVGKESRPWIKGSFLVFSHCGPHVHHVKHTGKKVRINFSFDLTIEYAFSFINK